MSDLETKETLEKTESNVAEEQDLKEIESENDVVETPVPIPFKPRVFNLVIDYSNKLISDMYDDLSGEGVEIFDIRQEFDNFDLYSMMFNLLCLSKLLYSSNINDKYDHMLKDMSNDAIHHKLNLYFNENCENNRIIILSLTTVKHEETDEFCKDSILGEVSVEINMLTLDRSYVISLKNATENKDIFELAKLICAIDYKYKTLCVNCGNRYRNTQKCNIFEINRS